LRILPTFQEEKDGEPGSKPQQLRVASKQQLFGAAAEGQAEAVSTSLQPGRLFKDEVLVLDCEWDGCSKTFSQVSSGIQVIIFCFFFFESRCPYLDLDL